MTRAIWKRCTRRFAGAARASGADLGAVAAIVAAILAVLGAPAPAHACGYIDDLEGPERGLFSLALLDDPDAAPFLYTRYQVFADGNNGVPSFTQINLDDWEVFFRKKLPREAWSALLYQAPLARIDGLIFALQGKRAPAAEDAPFTSYDDRPALIAALYYVGFARRVEPFAIEKQERDAWESQNVSGDAAARDQALGALIEGGERALRAAKAPFLRQRYALQILRAHFYRGDQAAVFAFFQKHRRQHFSDGSSAAWRALGYHAGALHAAGRYAEANVGYAMLFDRYPPMRHSALWSFHPQEERDWEEALRLARTPHDKTVLWQMLGIAHDGLRAMQAIYALDPRSKLLPLLLVREVVRAEVDAPVKAGPAPSLVAASQARTDLDPQRALVDFVDRVAGRGNAYRPALWSVAAGHLHAMRGERAPAQRFLDRAAALAAPGDETLLTQVRVTRFYALLRSVEAPSPADEATFAAELDWAASGPDEVGDSRRMVAGFAKGVLASLYGKRGDAFTARCLASDPDPVLEDPAEIDRFVAFLTNPRKTAFQKTVASLCPVTPQSLTATKGLVYAYRGDFDRAAAILATVKSDDLRGDPFAIRTRDCHSCDAADAETYRGPRYTTATFAARLAALAREAATTPSRAARDYYEIANGLYNMSTYGSLRGLLPESPLVKDCARAESFYGRAAEAAPDRELKARATFLAAKCALNDWYNDQKRSHDQRWFRTLRDSYADTRFYRDIIAECGYFRRFVGSRAPAGAPAGRR